MIKKILSNDFLQSSMIVTIATFFASVLNYGFNLVVARQVSLAYYGEYTSSLSYNVLFTIPLAAFSAILISKLGSLDQKQRYQFAAQLEAWLAQQFIAKAFIGAVVIGVTSWLLFTRANLHPVSIAFIIILTLTTIFQTFYNGTLNAYKAFLLYGAYTVAAALLKLGLAIPAIGWRPELDVLYGVILFVAIAQIGVGHFIIRDRKPTKSTTKAPIFQFYGVTTYLKKRAIWISLLCTLGVVGIANIDMALAKKFLSPDEAGLYGAISLLSKIILYVTLPLSSVGFVFFTGKEHKQIAGKLLIFITVLTSFIGLSATVMYVYAAPFVINLFFDQRFAALTSILWLAAVYGTLYSLVMLYSQYFLARNSILSALSLPALLLQVGSVYLFHDSTRTILLINIAVNSVLLFGYLVSFMIESNKAPSRLPAGGHA